MGIHETYLSQEKRDSHYRELKAQGLSLRRFSLRGQQLHPMYVTDFEGPERYDTGFGNTVYQTYFAVLYCLESR